MPAAAAYRAEPAQVAAFAVTHEEAPEILAESDLESSEEIVERILAELRSQGIV